MTYSPEAAAKYHDSKWLRRRAGEERAQAETYYWWNTHWRELGVSGPKLLFANGSWLGTPKKNAFLLVGRLHELGWQPDGPRLMLAVPRGPFHGCLIWFEDIESRESGDALAMKSALGNQGYEVVTARDTDSAIRQIKDYLAEPGGSPLTQDQRQQ